MASKRYHGGDGLLAGVVVSGGIVSDHFSILDVHARPDPIDLKTEGNDENDFCE